MTAGPLFQYSGGKSRAARYVWRALGDVRTYSEPFAGSAAVLFGRPPEHLTRGKRVEVLNDISGRITNMYRAVRDDPQTVWEAAQGARAELDLDARAAALNATSARLDERLRADPEWFDAKLAGWQLYVLRYAPHPQAALGGNRVRIGRPSERSPTLTQQDIRDVAVRFRTGHVMLLCGDWSRAVTERLLLRTEPGVTVGVFLDPPYLSADRDSALYVTEGRAAAAACRVWAIEHGMNPRYRIVLAGYTDEGRPPGWSEVFWASSAGGASRTRERLWLSPHCRVTAADPAVPLALKPENR